MMNDSKKLSSCNSSGNKSSGSSRQTHGLDQNILCRGTSGAALSAVNSNVNYADDDDDHVGTPTRSSRRGRSSMVLKGHDTFASKISTADIDGKHGSPGGPAAYLSSVRSNLNFDYSSSPFNDKTHGGSHTPGSNGNKNPQKKKSRLQESGSHKPAEVFRKDLISAMKIPDTSHLSPEEYWVMRDTWRMEWEKGVQVLVNPHVLPEAKIDIVPRDMKGDFRMPRKMIKTTPDVGDRDTVNLNVLADRTCRYDLDEVDVAWLEVVNEERHWQGYKPLDEFTMEIIMEELETQCHENLQLAIKTKEGLGIEYDENIVCDVCRLPDCEEGNEMVFCDGCNLCVHQACYGILKVPDGSWLCKPCALGIRGSAECILCGKKGGAMKSTKSGRKWAHISCALWIPEITIADPERMEPITKISHIPASRWSLTCSVCKEKSIGACIQCHVKHCVTAYHVTCAMDSGFDMTTDCCSPSSAPSSGEAAIVFRSYCQKHSKNYKKKFENSPGKKSEEEKRTDRQKRIAELEEEFYTLVKCEGVANSLNIPQDSASYVMEYWKLKRKANFNRPLLTPKQEEGKALEEAAETGLLRRLRMFTHLRQDLERVRNLCYMIGKREKLKRANVNTMSNIFLEQFHYLESLMLQNRAFNPKTLLTSLPKCGSPDLVKRAKEETIELMKTKFWSQDSSDEGSESQVPDDVDGAGETIRLVQPRSNVDVKAFSSEFNSPAFEKSSRKNGLVKGIKNPKVHQKSDKREKIKVEARDISSKGNSIKKIKSHFSQSSNIDRKKKRTRRDSQDSAISTDTIDDISKHKDLVTSNMEHQKKKSCRDSQASLQAENDSPTPNHKKKKLKDTESRNEKCRDTQEPVSSSQVIDNVPPDLDRRKKKSHKDAQESGSSVEASSKHKKLQSSVIELEKDSHRDSEDSVGGSRNTENSTSRHEDSKQKQVSPEQKSNDELELENHSVNDTVSSTKSDKKMSTQKGSWKRQSSSGSTKGNTLVKTEKIEEDSLSKVPSSTKKGRWSAKEDTAMKQPKVSAHKRTEKSRRSPRHLDSSELDDFERSNSVRTKSKMTINTETIHEIDRTSDKQKRDHVEGKSSLSKTGVDLPRKRSHDSKEHEPKEKKRKLSKLNDRSTSVEAQPISLRSMRSNSKNSDNDSVKRRTSPRSTCSTDDSETIKTDKMKVNKPKNVSRALAPSSGKVDGINAVCDKKEDIDVKKKKSSSRLSSVQGLEDKERLDSKSTPSLKVPASTHLSLTPLKSPIIVLEKPNPEFIAAGLNISYGSNALFPLRHSTNRKSPTKNKSTGLKWVSLHDDETHADDSSSIKDQDGYGGDMEESDLEVKNGSSKGHKKVSSKRRSSVNPGKYRTGIGVFSAKSSESSDDDFDISFSNSISPGNSRQKLRSISNNTNFEATSQSNQPEETVSKPLSERKMDSNKKVNEPKNVKAVGGTLGALKSERDSNLPPFIRTADGHSSQDNFFDRMSYLSDKTFESSSSFNQTSQSDISSPPFHPDKIMDFQPVEIGFQSHSLFPLGTPINPWQVASSALPSIVPNQYPPVFPPFTSPHQHDPKPSPPPLPDSTLSPESYVPNSASVAVQAFSDRSVTPLKSDKGKGSRKYHLNSKEEEDGNQWMIVRDDDDFVDSPVFHHHHHHKHKKKKKKKKKRKRMLFPDDYESDKRELSSPASLPEPTHGAIVPKGHSAQYVAEATSSTMSENTEKQVKPQKLVLKINKKALITSTDNDSPASSVSSTVVEKESTGLKLTIKKSQYEHVIAKSKEEKKSNEMKSKYVNNFSNSVMQKDEKKSGMLRRLGINDNERLAVQENDGIGRHALRERKVVQKKDKDQSNTDQSEKRKHKKVPDRKKHLSSSAPRSNDIKSNPDVPKRQRGRPKKGQTATSESDGIKQEPQDGKDNDQPSRDERKDLAKFAGWSTKTSKYGNLKSGKSLPRTASIGSILPLSFKPSFSGHRGKGGNVPIRSFSTDSDHNSSISSTVSQDNQPARHWKKRKVQEHETQATNEQPEGTKQETSTSFKHCNSILSNSVDDTSKVKKSPKGRSTEVQIPKSEKPGGLSKGQKLNQIISSLGEKASLKAGPTVLSRESDKKPKSLSLKTNLPAKPSPSRNAITPSPSKEKNLFAKFPSSSFHPMHEKDARTAGTSFPGTSTKQRTKSESAYPTQSKSHGTDFNLDNVLLSGPVNYKIPKKLHKTSTEANFNET